MKFAEYKLFQNYSNLFNPTTKSLHSPPGGGSGVTVQLVVYDILGREVVDHSSFGEDRRGLDLCI
jgi:hypothetical protein